MRIISGKYRGRRLSPPANLPVRPTTDMAREALFSILYSRYDFEDLRVLDLFCGTGALSFEFISRACPDVTAVDESSKCIDFIRKTSQAWNAEGLRAVRADVFRFLEQPMKPFDIIFADPPYIMKESRLLPALVRAHNLLAPEGRLIIEHPAELDFSNEPGFLDVRSYSRVHFTFFEYSPPEDSQAPGDENG